MHCIAYITLFICSSTHISLLVAVLNFFSYLLAASSGPGLNFSNNQGKFPYSVTVSLTEDRHLSTYVCNVVIA
jgi:hypothetical protein